MALCGCLIVGTGAAWALPHALSPRVLLRGLADVGGTVFFLSALVRMPMGDVFGILQFTPLAITAAAALFRARVGWRRWTATCVGLVGVLIIVRPGGHAFTPYALLVMTSVVFSVARDLLTRGVGTGVPTLVIAGASASIVTLSSLGFTLFEFWIRPSPATVLFLAAASVALLAGQYCLDRRHAHRRDRRGGAVPLFHHSVGRPLRLSRLARGAGVYDWLGHRHRLGSRALHLPARAAPCPDRPRMTDPLDRKRIAVVEARSAAE